MLYNGNFTYILQQKYKFAKTHDIGKDQVFIGNILP